MTAIHIVLLAASEDLEELTSLGLGIDVDAETVPALLSDNPSLSRDTEIRETDIEVSLVLFDASSGALLDDGSAVLDGRLEGREVDALLFVFGREGCTRSGAWELMRSREATLATKRLPIVIVDPHRSAADFERSCATFSEYRYRSTAAGSASPLPVHDLRRIQDTFREHVKSILRMKRSPSVAVGALLIAQDSGRLFLGKKLRGVGRGEWATVGGNLTQDGDIGSALIGLVQRRFGNVRATVGPLLACTVMRREGVRFVDLTFLTVLEDERIDPDSEEFAETRWLSISQFQDCMTSATVFEPVKNSFVKYVHLKAAGSSLSLLGSLTFCEPGRAPQIVSDIVALDYPESYRSPHFFESA